MSNIILVPTDLSVNSAAGVRFAMQLAKQGRRSLVFYHCIPLMKPTRWSEEKYRAYVKEQVDEARMNLDRFIQRVYKVAGIRRSKVECVVQHCTDVHRAIIDYALEIKANSICMSTRGAGRLRKILGTHASAIIHSSPIPVFVIPKNYRRSAITRMLYASDLDNIAEELKRVSEFSSQLKAKISVYHYDYLADVPDARKKLEAVAQRHKRPGVDFKFQKFNIDKSLGQHLITDMRKLKASVAVLFTDQKRGWFDNLFLSSRAADVAFNSRIPLLVFPKK